MLLALTSCTSAYEKELEAFHAERTHEITTEWITLVGRIQLSDGENALTIPGYDGVLGTLTVGDQLLWNGTPISDDSKGAPTIFEHGSLRMHVITRGPLHFLRAKDLKHPCLRRAIRSR